MKVAEKTGDGLGRKEGRRERESKSLAVQLLLLL